MWEVDPETRSKIQEIQKREGNNTCCDCGAPSPQWASPKFGTFICLSCAGTHRGLGVHISFVRSVSMDAFKVGEIARMDKGGNKSWRKFFEAHETTKGSGLGWNETTIPDRYGGDVGDEWKQRLTATVEGREYVPEEKPKAEATRRTGTPLSGDGPVSTSDSARKASNEAYFARLSAQNAARPAGPPPSQGGKYAGFGSDSTEQNTNNPPVMPTAEDFQKDPVAALSKGFGWFSTTVGKGAKTVNDSLIQPAAQKIAEADIATQAREHASQLGQNISSGTRTAADSLNRLVDNGGDSTNALNPTSQQRPTASATSNKDVSSELDDDKKQFWDSFGHDESAKKPSSSSTTTNHTTVSASPLASTWGGLSAWAGGITGSSSGSSGGDGGATGTSAAANKPSAIGTAAMRKSS